eukprot:CAMPEP_0168527232 /NCGR_PEP_ID=MMETSP0405-20121227/12470_1 /TAXON_ID=498012 /ORGANISM="Trichosphaerium sp, Strain Am-I-7 wt" /LENGTH=448 /DNA_ID=CAMNT_0008550285 /DNA_START=194 /DNA_END=1540 /DNA_ORIENTATION=+
MPLPHFGIYDKVRVCRACRDTVALRKIANDPNHRVESATGSVLMKRKFAGGLKKAKSLKETVKQKSIKLRNSSSGRTRPSSKVNDEPKPKAKEITNPPQIVVEDVQPTTRSNISKSEPLQNTYPQGIAPGRASTKRSMSTWVAPNMKRKPSRVQHPIGLRVEKPEPILSPERMEEESRRRSTLANIICDAGADEINEESFEKDLAKEEEKAMEERRKERKKRETLFMKKKMGLISSGRPPALPPPRAPTGPSLDLSDKSESDDKSDSGSETESVESDDDNKDSGSETESVESAKEEENGIEKKDDTENDDTKPTTDKPVIKKPANKKPAKPQSKADAHKMNLEKLFGGGMMGGPPTMQSDSGSADEDELESLPTFVEDKDLGKISIRPRLDAPQRSRPKGPPGRRLPTRHRNPTTAKVAKKNAKASGVKTKASGVKTKKKKGKKKKFL